MNNPNQQQSPALRIEAGSCFFISWKKHDQSESLTAEQLYAFQFFRIILLILYVRRNAQSITMITDGRGNVISGGNNGGKSHISYTPYGSIHRTDSSGPDITRFKFTGQEEDKESGLLYYKARYYDPMLGRFLQADTVTDIDETYGMNPYMYVEGNPVRYNDPTGHNKNNPMLGAIIGYVMAEQFGVSKEQGAMLGGYAASGKTNIRKDMAGGAGVFLLANSGTTGAQFLGLAFAAWYAGKTERNTWFKHNYTGSGNKDYFSSLNSNDTETRTDARFKFIVVAAILNKVIFKDNPITLEQAVGFLMITKMLSPRPKSYSDKLSRQHDRDVPSSQLRGSPMQHMKADMNYFRGYMDGFRTGEIFRQPADIIIGFGGVVGLSLDFQINAVKYIGGSR